MTRTATRRPQLTPAAKARQLKLLQATAERITRDHYITFIAGVTPKVVVFNRTTLKEKRLDLIQASTRWTALQGDLQPHGGTVHEVDW